MRTTKQVNLSLPAPLAEQVDKIAKTEYRTKSEILREALRDYLRKRLKENDKSEAH